MTVRTSAFRTLVLASLSAAILGASVPTGAFAAGKLTANAADLVPIPSRMKHGTVSVRNAGSGPAGASIVTVVCKKKGAGSCAESAAMARYTNPAYPNALVIPVPALAKGKVYNFKLPFWNGLVWANGNYKFTMKADAAGSVAETNEGNNKKAATVPLP